MLTEKRVKGLITELLMKELEKGFIVDEAYTSNDIPSFYMSRGSEKLKIAVEREHVSHPGFKGYIHGPKLIISVGGVVKYELYEYGSDFVYAESLEELYEAAAKSRDRIKARHIPIKPITTLPQSFVNLVRKERGFGVATKKNLIVTRTKYGEVVVVIDDPRTSKKEIRFYYGDY